MLAPAELRLGTIASPHKQYDSVLYVPPGRHPSLTLTSLPQALDAPSVCLQMKHTSQTCPVKPEVCDASAGIVSQSRPLLVRELT